MFVTDERSPSEQIEIELDLAPGMEAEEGTLDRRRINTPARQGGTIPAGWKPSSRKPIPVVRCHYVWPDSAPRGGDRCNRWSLRGSQLCYIHSGRGNLRNVEEYRKSIIEAARLQLTEFVPDALSGLIDLAENATGENVRLKAYTEVLDRAGLKTAEELNVNLEVTAADPATTLAQRIDGLRRAADIVRQKEEEARLAREAQETEQALALTAGGSDDSEIVDAEIVEDSRDDTAGTL